MALTQISRVASTSGDIWTDIVTGPASVASLVLANKSFGSARVSVRLLKVASPALPEP